MTSAAMELDLVLSQLENAQLVRRLAEQDPSSLEHPSGGLEQGIAYVFKHALTQEAAYISLLVKSRREIHRRVAEAYEASYPARLDEFAALLAQHYAEAGEDEKTLEYANRAGDISARIYANDEAIAYYSLAITMAERLTATLPKQFVDLYTKRGRALELNGQHEQAFKTYERLEEFSRERREPSLELGSLMLRSTLYIVHTRLHDPDKGAVLAHSALALAKELGDRQAEARILWSLMLACQWGSGGVNKAIEYGEKAVALSRELGLEEQLAYALSDLAYPYVYVGQMGKALALREEADPIWRKLDIKPMISDNLTGMANITVMTGGFSRGIKAAEEAFGISDAFGNQWGQAYSQVLLGMIYCELARLDDAAAALGSGISHSEAVGAIGPLVAGSIAQANLYLFVGAFEPALEAASYADSNAKAQLPEWRPWTLATLARINIQMGDLNSAEEKMQDLPDSVEGMFKGVWVRGAFPGCMARGELALMQGDLDRATAFADGLVTVLRDRGMNAVVPDALQLQGAVLQSRGETHQAARILRQARDEAIAVDARRSLFAISASLMELERREGIPIGKGDTEKQFREQLAYVLERTTRHDLREALVKLPFFSSVLEVPVN